MKTIEQASLENSKQHYIHAFSEELHKDADMDFRKGIEFAQQWISVEDELPEKNSGTIFIKGIDTYNEVEYSVGYMEKSFGIVDNGQDLIKITHWRPIDRT